MVKRDPKIVLYEVIPSLQFHSSVVFLNFIFPSYSQFFSRSSRFPTTRSRILVDTGATFSRSRRGKWNRALLAGRDIFTKNRYSTWMFPDIIEALHSSRVIDKSCFCHILTAVIHSKPRFLTLPSWFLIKLKIVKSRITRFWMVNFFLKSNLKNFTNVEK